MDEPSHAYINLTTMMETGRAWFEEGAVVWNEEYAEMDKNIGRAAAIHQTFNPGIRFPYHVE